MNGMIREVVAGVLAEVITDAGRRIGIATSAMHGRRYAQDSAIVRWFDTYQLTDRILELPDLSPQGDEWLTAQLNSDEVQALLHELLAARLTKAPSADIERLRTAMELTLLTKQPPPTVSSNDLASTLFDYYDYEICTLAGRLEGAEPAFWREICSQAVSARLIAVLHAIERHVAALSSRPNSQSEADFLIRYRRHVVEQHGKIEPPDFERRRRVPIASLYVAPGIIQLASGDAEVKPRELDLWQLNKELDRTVLLGDPGGGKTTAAHVLMHHHAAEPGSRVPFLVTLREFAVRDPPERSVAGHIDHQLDAFYQCPAPPGLVDWLLLAGRALVVFDGLDELLDTSRRTEVSARIERFCTEYPLTPVLVTSRLVGYDQARLDDALFTRYRIGGFSDELVSDYVVKWFALEEGIDEPSQWAAAFLDESATIPDLRANPLMLALMCILYRGEGSLPRNRTEVYEQCAILLFRKWDARRRIHADLRAGHHLEAALRHLAWWLFSRDEPQPAVTEHELVAEAASFLLGVGFEAEADASEAASEFVTFCRGRMWVFSDLGTTRDGQELYSFTHRTFLEYFAAAHLAYSCDSPEQLASELIPHVAGQEWEVVGELAVQIKNNTSSRGAPRIFAAMLNDRLHDSAVNRGGLLQFLGRCLRSVDPSPPVVRQLSKEILDRFFTGDPNDSTLYVPLCWLLASCVGYTELVNDELRSKLTTVITSNRAGTRLIAINLLFWLQSCLNFTFHGTCPHLPSSSPLVSYWRQREDEYLTAHTEAVIAAAKTDYSIRLAAYYRDLIKLDEGLEMRGGLTAFFESTPPRGFEVSFGSALPWLIRNVIANCAPSERLPDLDIVGRYLIAHPAPPWIMPVSAWSPDDWASSDLSDDSGPVLSVDGYLGAVAIMLMIVETMDIHEIPKSLGPLNELIPYIKHRWQTEPECPLPSLPVPPSFQQMFRDWAENLTNFVGVVTELSQR